MQLHHAQNLSQNNGKKKKLKKPIRQLHPLNQEKSYQKALREIVQRMKIAIDQLLIPRLPALVAEANMNKDRPMRDDASSDTDQIFIQIRAFLDKHKDIEIARQYALDINNFNAAQWRKQIKHMFDLNIFANEPWLQDHISAWVSVNTGLIKSLKDTALSQVEYQVKQGFAQGLRHESIGKNIAERIGVAISRANFIARDQSSKLNGQLNELRQTDLGIKEYVWTTAHDKRVRDSHAEQDGITYSWDDPPEETGNPGEDYNCRCIAQPVFSEDLFA